MGVGHVHPQQLSTLVPRRLTVMHRLQHRRQAQRDLLDGTEACSLEAVGVHAGGIPVVHHLLLPEAEVQLVAAGRVPPLRPPRIKVPQAPHQITLLVIWLVLPSDREDEGPAPGAQAAGDVVAHALEV